jgi:thymidine phosphorylase
VTQRANTLRLRRIGIDTHQETVIYMRRDCHICRAEGFSVHARIRVTKGATSIIATLNQITTDFLAPGEASLSEAAWQRLGVKDGDEIIVDHPRPLDSLSRVRAKVYGHQLSEMDLQEIIRDVVAGRYSDVHLASFITACVARGLDRDEMVALTRAMVDVGDQLDWGKSPIVDKHCVGGLPGNRTTPIVVAIATACGLTMPKTSSRAITSPAGTADTMETLTPVDLDLDDMRRVVEKEGGCIVWGGAVRLSPADDVLIRVERALDVDSEGQLVASVLSKKAAAGSTHLVLDLPVGPTAKIRDAAGADALSADLLAVARALGFETRIVLSDGTQPVGRGIGPSLEARDVLAVLQGAADAPLDLRARAVSLAGVLLELALAAPDGTGADVAEAVLRDGRAWSKFQAICEAQGGLREPPRSAYQQPILASQQSRVTSIDNRLLAKAAKLAGAPDAKAAGLELHTPIGRGVEEGEPLFTLHAETRGELAYALDYVESHEPIVQLEIG